MGDLVGSENCGGQPLHNVRNGATHGGRRPRHEFESELRGGQLDQQRAPLLASFVLPTPEEVRDTVRLEGRSVFVQTRGLENGSKVHETAVLLRLESRLQLAAFQSLHVGVAHGS